MLKLPAIQLFRHSFNIKLVKLISTTSVRRLVSTMPFDNHKIVPDVIPLAPKDILKIDYASGGK